MQKLDKVFAGLILVAMALFWVIMSPAAITSRVSEAKPISVMEDAPTGDELDRRRAVAERAKRRVAERRISRQKIDRLKRRNRDTPVDGQARLREGLLQSAPRPAEGDAPVFQNFDDIVDRPVFN